MDPKPLPRQLDAGPLTLRLPEPDDEAEVVAMLSADTEIARWTTVPFPYGPVQFSEFLALAATDYEAGTGLHFVIHDLEGRRLGAVGTRIQWDTNTADIGYWLGAEARGRGVATTTAQAICHWLAEQGLARIEAEVLEGNPTSGRVLTRLGFVMEAVVNQKADRCGLDPDGQINVEKWAHDLS